MVALTSIGSPKVKSFVQAKRYKLAAKIKWNTVRRLPQRIPFGGQGAFITTADFQSAAADVALETGFSRIGMVNGRQLLDLLVEHREDIPPASGVSGAAGAPARIGAHLEGLGRRPLATESYFDGSRASRRGAP